MAGGLDRTSIGKNLAALRKERGETVADVAAATGVCQSAISMYENGYRVPRDDVKKKLSRHFGVTVEQIFFAE